MNQNLNPEFESSRRAEETLRMVAQLRPPAELTDRVHQRLESERLQMERETPVRRGIWSLWMPARRLQFASAAALAVAVAASTWTVYHLHPQAGGAQVAPSATHAVTPHETSPRESGSFGIAGTEHLPPTLKPIKVPPAPKKKPSASRIVAKPSPKTLAAQPADDAAAKQPSNQ